MDPRSPTGERLDSREVARYSRHLTLPEVGVAGQLRLRAASVLLVGVGGLGSPLGLYLAAAGVGRIGIVDFDRVDLSNLQRQVLYSTEDIGRSKVQQAKQRLAQVNPHVEIVPHEIRLAADNALQTIEPYDIVVDGTDNFPTRYLVNDACVLLGKPHVYGSIFRFEGQVSLFRRDEGPCYRCLYPEPPAAGEVPNCAEGGVLGVLPGIIGTLQATETLKWILGRGESLLGRLLLFDALEMRFRELSLRKDPACPVCGETPTITELSDAATGCERPEEIPDTSGFEVDPPSLQEQIAEGRGPLLLDVRTDQEWAICHLEGARLIPMRELATRIGELDPATDIVVYCHLGRRSAMMTNFLLQRGFRRVRNLVGGIDAWSQTVDPDLPRY